MSRFEPQVTNKCNAECAHAKKSLGDILLGFEGTYDVQVLSKRDDMSLSAQIS